MSVFVKALLQEFLTPPSRISTVDLMKKYVLPSTLSRFQTIKLPSPLFGSRGTQKPKEATMSSKMPKTTEMTTTTTNEELGVHYIQYESRNKRGTAEPPRFQAIHCNHGFGASSLSWLPVLPRLVDRLRTRVGVGHDAVGFGFTDRPAKDDNKQYLARYTTKGSSEIGTALLQRVLNETDADAYSDEKKDTNITSEEISGKPVILMGHSLGSLTTLQMALALPKTTRKWVILVAPALGMNRSSNANAGNVKSEESSHGSKKNKVKEALISGVSAVGRYALRRLVG